MIVGLAVVLAWGGVAARADGGRVAIRAKAYITKEGAAVEPAVLVVEGGKIAAVGADVGIPDGCTVLDRPEATISAGLIDLHVALGTAMRTGEAAHAAEPQADAADLFNRFHRDFERAVRAGVTTVLLAPASTHLVGGRTVAVKTAGVDAEGRIVGPGPMKLSLAGIAFTTQRPPTSLEGGLDELRRMIKAARANPADESAFAAWPRGEATAIVDVVGEGDLSGLARFAAAEGVKCVALHANYAAERLADARSLGQPVVVGPYEFSDSLRFTRAPAMLAAEGIPFALISDAPHAGPEALRAGAAMAMAQGLDRVAAYAAVTTAPARIAGVADHVGSLEPGKDADFVLWSGHPLDLTSRVLEVFVDGRRVYRAPESVKETSDRDAGRKAGKGRRVEQAGRGGG